MRSVWRAVLVATCVVYGGTGIVLGVVEALAIAGSGAAESTRSAPIAFVVHAIAGGIALPVGAIQLAAEPVRSRRLHVVLGRTYAAGAVVASTAGIATALSFNDTIATRLILITIATAWLTSTAVAVWHIRAGRWRVHRIWMVRSFATACFFVTFEAWVAVASTVTTASIGRPMGILLSWVANVAVAEWLLRRGPDHAAGAPLPLDSRLLTIAAARTWRESS